MQIQDSHPNSRRGWISLALLSSPLRAAGALAVTGVALGVGYTGGGDLGASLESSANVLHEAWMDLSLIATDPDAFFEAFTGTTLPEPPPAY